MKKTLCSLVLAGLLTIGVTAYAQDNSAQPPASGPASGQEQGNGGGHRGMDPDQQLQHMTKALNLSADQQGQIKPILQSQHDQMMQLHQDQSLSREDRMAKAKSLMTDSHSKIEAVLNDQQKQKFEEMQQKMQARRGQGGPPQQ